MFNQSTFHSDRQNPNCRRSPRATLLSLCALSAGILFFGILSAHGIDLADAPMFTKINPPPANLMILQDDSGSMTYEILVRGQYEGMFPNPDSSDNQGFCYVFDNMGDGYNYPDSWRHMGEEGRKYWRSQWFEVNVIYYNPNVVYEPWPSHAGKTFPQANTGQPLVHPLKSKKLTLTQKAFSVDNVTVPWSHYFVKSAEDGNVYLVIIDGQANQNEYYRVSEFEGTEPLDKIKSLVLEPSPPADIIRDHADDLQNFANWFTYHRRREFVAKAAIARVLRELDSVRVGILGINEEVVVPLKPVKAVIGAEFRDKTDEIIAALYEYESGGGTPLKEGLDRIGEYYRKNDGNLAGEDGDAPYPQDGGACQQSFTIVVTDGYYSDYRYGSVGNADGDPDNAAWGGGQKPYADGYENTLADIAMHYYAIDLSPDPEDTPPGDGFEDLVPTNKWDGAPHQHMVTFAVAFGVSGTLVQEDYENDRTSADYLKSKTTGEYVVWPKVSGNRQPESIDDLWHATVNGRGVFVHAGHPQKVVEGLLQIIRDIKSRQPTSTASVTVNGDWLYGQIGPDVLIFQGSYSYIDGTWAGDVRAYTLDQITGEVITESAKWSAAEKLQNTNWGTRNILTFDGAGSGQRFLFSDLTPVQKAKLGADAEDIVDYIRGKDPDSNGNRVNMLGDVVHSSPVFINDFIYFGANDGMLHAVKADDGTEVFAYVPYLVFDHLKDLADPASDHWFYVDLTPTVKTGEKLLDDSGQQTILVSGLGKGGMGYAALDITYPLTMGPDQVLWEFPDEGTSQADVKDMGYSYSKPVVVKSYSADHPWIVIFGNGYNSQNGDSVLFILDARTGEVIKKIRAGSGPDNGLSSPIAVDINYDDIVDFVYAGDLRGNLWKFDLISNIDNEWVVAFKDLSLNAVPLFTALDPAGNPQPITSKPDVMFHPAQHGLIVAFGTGKFLGIDDYADIQTQTIYGIWDYGDRYFPTADGIWSTDDDDEYLGAFESRNEAIRQLSSPYLSENVKLLKQKARDYQVDSTSGQITVRILTHNQPIWETQPDPDGGDQFPDPLKNYLNDAGWYLDLDVYSGERVVSDIILRDGIMIVIGFIPEQSRCGSGGDSVFMELNAFTGGTIGAIQFDIHDDGTVDEGDLVEVEIDGEKVIVAPSGKKLAGLIQPPAILRKKEKDKDEEKKYLSSSSGEIVTITEKAAKIGIAYWMEILE